MLEAEIFGILMFHLGLHTGKISLKFEILIEYSIVQVYSPDLEGEGERGRQGHG